MYSDMTLQSSYNLTCTVIGHSRVAVTLHTYTVIGYLRASIISDRTPSTAVILHVMTEHPRIALILYVVIGDLYVTVILYDQVCSDRTPLSSE